MNGAPTSIQTASDAWVKELETEGYDHHCEREEDIRHAGRISRTWRRILKTTGVRPPARAFELGSGGGVHLVSLALNGLDVHGIDVSPDVVRRCEQYVEEVAQFRPEIADRVRVDCCDLQAFWAREEFDLAFQFGVVEHFLHRSDRVWTWRQMKAVTKPGGWVVSEVPCGKSFVRDRIKRLGLCGYNIPEHDYGFRDHVREFEEAGLRNVSFWHTAYLNFYPAIPGASALRPALFPLCLGANVVMPYLPMPATFKERLAHSLIVVGQNV
jgi:SAM-dependent methyltransferase